MHVPPAVDASAWATFAIGREKSMLVAQWSHQAPEKAIKNYTVTLMITLLTTTKQQLAALFQSRSLESCKMMCKRIVLAFSALLVQFILASLGDGDDVGCKGKVRAMVRDVALEIAIFWRLVT